MSSNNDLSARSALMRDRDEVRKHLDGDARSKLGIAALADAHHTNQWAAGTFGPCDLPLRISSRMD
jgi:hypothetical protein